MSNIVTFIAILIPVIVAIIFITVFMIIIVKVAKSITQSHKDNNSPVLTVEAKVLAKRMAVDGMHHGGNMAMNNSTYSSYYITFEVENGDRIELKVPGTEYGLVVEGDIGRLTYQGTRYKGFERYK